MDKKITIGNVCFVQDKTAGTVLLLKRNRDPMKDMCTGVGGKTDFHEDIRTSCFREVKEETGLCVTNVRLKGILKTILAGTNSSWILFAYTADKKEDVEHVCDEGTLQWVPQEELYSQDLIGFIRHVLPYILDDSSFFEGTIIHDMQGNVLEHDIDIPKTGFGIQ